MKGKFLIRNYEFTIIPEISYSDYMDGTPDTMSFSFRTSDNLSDEIQIKEKCEVQIWEIPEIVVGQRNEDTIIINNIEYDIDYVSEDEINLKIGDNIVGSIFTDIKSILIGEKQAYYYKDEDDPYAKIYKDNKLHYYMCVSNVSSEKMSTNSDENGYITTVKLKEQTVLLKDCVRTDIAITPSLYPQLEIVSDDGESKTTKNIYDNLYDATLKIVDCHNMCCLNEPIKSIDDDLIESLKKVACPNLTYRDLSTYSQLYDVFMRVGRIPYFSDGTLYGIKLQGNNDEDEVIDLGAYSHLSSLKEEGTNDNIYSTKVYNNIYDKEVAVVPQIFTDMVNNICFTPTKVAYGSSSVDVTYPDGFYKYLGRFVYNSTVYFFNRSYSIGYYGVPYEVVNSTNLSLKYEVNMKNLTFEINGVSFSIFGEYDSRNTSSGADVSTMDTPVLSRKLNIPWTATGVNTGAISTFLEDEFHKWTRLNSQDESDISKTLLYVKGFNTESVAINDARTYSLQLPYGIEKIEHIYSCKPYIKIEDKTYNLPYERHDLYAKPYGPNPELTLDGYIDIIYSNNEIYMFRIVLSNGHSTSYGSNFVADPDGQVYSSSAEKCGTVNLETMMVYLNNSGTWPFQYVIDETHTDGNGDFHFNDVYFSWKLKRYDDDKIIEESLYDYLSDLQKRTVCYYRRGSKSINNVICLNIEDNDDTWDILKVTDSDVQGAFAWSNAKLYAQLRSQFYVVEYKPILDTYYTNYDYYYGELNKPKSISNFNFPYNEVSDKQAYPILEYNLEKGLDTSHDVKIITTDISILNIHAGDIVSYNGNKYLVNIVSSYINNKTIESSFCLTDNVIQNSILSYYTDNVRVSSVLSAESVVNRPIHLFGENVLHFYDYANLENDNRNYNPEYFIEEIGYCLSQQSIYGCGIGDFPDADNLNSYKAISKYPFRFDNIVTPELKINTNADYVIRLSTGDAEEDEKYIELYESDFPLTICIMIEGGHYNDEPTNLKTVKSIYELENELYNIGYVRIGTFIFNWTIGHCYLGVKKHGSNEFISLRPSVAKEHLWPTKKDSIDVIVYGETTSTPLDRWPEFAQEGYKYRLYDRNKEYGTTKYGTEKLVTNTGLITKIEYCFPDSSYATSKFENAQLLYSTNMWSTLNDGNTYEDNFDISDYNVGDTITQPNIRSTQPVYFNLTETGCKLAGIGNNEGDFYSLYKLNHISNYGYYLDLRENPRPYLQFKTMCRGDSSIITKQLSKDIDYIKCGIMQPNTTNNLQAVILKVPRFENIDNIIIDEDTMEDIIYSTTTLNQKLSKTKLYSIDINTPLVKSDEYDYMIYMVDPNHIEKSLKLLKFNIAEGKTVSRICIDQKIYSEV